MLPWETFLTTLYVMVDDFCQAHLGAATALGRPPALSRSETMTLAIFRSWRRFASERDFYRWAQRHLLPFFPSLPDRSQYNRQLRRHRADLEAFTLFLAQQLHTPQALFETLDRTAAPTRNVKRRGRGWLAGQTDIGYSNRLGWFHGFGVLLATTPDGVLTGWGFGPASAKDQPLAEVFFAARHRVVQGQRPCEGDPRLPGASIVCLGSVGVPVTGIYLADKGFQGPKTHARWRQRYQAEVLAPPQSQTKHPWPKGWRRLHASARQIVETVVEKLDHALGLADERPHTLGGFAARLAARCALHDFCISLNQRLNRPSLAFVDLVAW